MGSYFQNPYLPGLGFVAQFHSYLIDKGAAEGRAPPNTKGIHSKFGRRQARYRATGDPVTEVALFFQTATWSADGFVFSKSLSARVWLRSAISLPRQALFRKKRLFFAFFSSIFSGIVGYVR